MKKRKKKNEERGKRRRMLEVEQKRKVVVKVKVKVGARVRVAGMKTGPRCVSLANPQCPSGVIAAHERQSSIIGWQRDPRLTIQTLSDRPGETAEPITTDTSAQPANQPDLRKPDGASSRPRRSVVPRASAVAAAQAKHNGASKDATPESAGPTATASETANPNGSPAAIVTHETASTEKDDIVIPDTAIKASLRSKGTLGKGKKKRGTVLWSSDSVDEDKEAEVGAEHQVEDENGKDKEDGDAVPENDKAMPVQEEGRLL